jgi:hypothetical protein
MLERSATEIFAVAEEIASNAALLGAKMVTSVRPSTAETRSALVRAPTREVRPAAWAVAPTAEGMLRTESIT